MDLIDQDEISNDSGMEIKLDLVRNGIAHEMCLISSGFVFEGEAATLRVEDATEMMALHQLSLRVVSR